MLLSPVCPPGVQYCLLCPCCSPSGCGTARQQASECFDPKEEAPWPPGASLSLSRHGGIPRALVEIIDSKNQLPQHGGLLGWLLINHALIHGKTGGFLPQALAWLFRAENCQVLLQIWVRLRAGGGDFFAARLPAASSGCCKVEQELPGGAGLKGSERNKTLGFSCTSSCRKESWRGGSHAPSSGSC